MEHYNTSPVLNQSFAIHVDFWVQILSVFFYFVKVSNWGTLLYTIMSNYIFLLVTLWQRAITEKGNDMEI